MAERDISHWADWSDGELIDQAAGASQSRVLLENETVREAIALNVIAPLRQALAKARSAIATEAHRAETVQHGSVHEGAGPKDIAQ